MKKFEKLTFITSRSVRNELIYILLYSLRTEWADLRLQSMPLIPFSYLLFK